MPEPDFMRVPDVTPAPYRTDASPPTVSRPATSMPPPPLPLTP